MNLLVLLSIYDPYCKHSQLICRVKKNKEWEVACRTLKNLEAIHVDVSSEYFQFVKVLIIINSTESNDPQPSDYFQYLYVVFSFVKCFESFKSKNLITGKETHYRNRQIRGGGGDQSATHFRFPSFREMLTSIMIRKLLNVSNDSGKRLKKKEMTFD